MVDNSPKACLLDRYIRNSRKPMTSTRPTNNTADFRACTSDYFYWTCFARINTCMFKYYMPRYANITDFGVQTKMRTEPDRKKGPYSQLDSCGSIFQTPLKFYRRWWKHRGFPLNTDSKTLSCSGISTPQSITHKPLPEASNPYTI